MQKKIILILFSILGIFPHWGCAFDSAQNKEANIDLTKKMFFASEVVQFVSPSKKFPSNTSDVIIENNSGKILNTKIIANDSLITLGKMDVGWYKVSLNQNNGNTEFSFVVVPDRRNQNYKESKFGIHLKIDSLGLEKIKYLGAGWIRLHGTGSDILKWSLVEKKQGEYNWHYNLIKPFIDKGYGILANVGLCPLWASSNPTAESYPNKSTYFGPYAYVPSNMSLWKGYLEKAYGQYRNAIDYWEIWNEPDIQFLVSPNKVEDYQKLLGSALEVKQENDGNFKIAAPAIAYYFINDNPNNQYKYPGNTGVKYRDPGFLTGFLNRSLSEDIDVFSFHHYMGIKADQYNYTEKEFNNYYEKINYLKKKLPNKKIFLTEFNVHSDNKEYNAQIDQLLANLLVFQHLQLFSVGVDKIFTYTAVERNSWAVWNNFFYNGDNPTQVFQAYSVMTSYLTGYNLTSRNFNPDNGTITFDCSNGKNTIIIYFASKDINITISSDCIISDYLGKSLNVSKGAQFNLNRNHIYYKLPR